MWPEDPNWARCHVYGGAAVVLVRHPVAFGNSNERWDALGRWLRCILGRIVTYVGPAFPVAGIEEVKTGT